MKKLLFLSLLIALLSCGCIVTHGYESVREKSEPENVPVIIKWSHKNLVDGFNHPCRIMVFIDGKAAGTSGIVEQSESGKYDLQVSPGKHIIRVEVYVYYKNWELESKANEYSVDAFFERELNFSAPVRLNLVMDIGKEKSELVVE